MSKSILIVAAGLLAIPAFAQAPTKASDRDAEAKDPDRKICERISKTGSRLNFVTVCLTADQWKTLRMNHRQDTEAVQRIVNQSPSN